MFRPFSFAETEGWKKAVTKTYPLTTSELNLQNTKIQLYGNGKEFSNSPYITDGGFFTFNKPIVLDDILPIQKPILLKSRNAIDMDVSIPHVLCKDYFTYLLDLREGEKAVWKNKVKSKTRNQVRKAEKLTYEVKFGKLDLLDDFYSVISEAWRDLGTPTHSKSFYKNIIENLNSNGYGSCFMILYVQSKPASVACLIFDEYSIHHPYAATLKEYNKYSLNNALYWQIIKFAISKEVHFFDMGRSKKGQGTELFKLSWGAEPIQLYYYYLNKKSHTNDEDGKFVQFAIRMWKKLPLTISNFLGPKLIYKVLK
jgi:hypothetical protein